MNNNNNTGRSPGPQFIRYIYGGRYTVFDIFAELFFTRNNQGAAIPKFHVTYCCITFPCIYHGDLTSVKTPSRHSEHGSSHDTSYRSILSRKTRLAHYPIHSVVAKISRKRVTSWHHLKKTAEGLSYRVPPVILMNCHHPRWSFLEDDTYGTETGRSSVPNHHEGGGMKVRVNNVY